MDNTKIYVGNLSYNTSESSLREYFTQFGSIEHIKVIMDDMGRSKGFGFITFTNADEAKNAIDANGKELDGRTLKVSAAKDNNTRTGGAGGQRRTGGGQQRDRY